MVGKVIVAINPYKDIEGLYSDEQMRKYREQVVEELSPHIYLIGECILFS